MANNYFQFMSAYDSPTFTKVKVMFEGFAPVDTPLQTVARTMNGKLSINQNGDRASVYSATGFFRVKHTPDSGYASAAKVKEWMLSNVENKRSITMKDELNVQHTVMFTSPYAPVFSNALRDSNNGYDIVPFEVQEV